MTQHTIYKDLKHLYMCTQAGEGKDSNRNGWMDADATGTGIAPRASRTRARVEIRRSDIDSLADI